MTSTPPTRVGGAAGAPSRRLALAALAAAAALALASAGPPCAEGTDFPNNDLPGMPVPLPGRGLANATAQAVCASMCAAEPQCTTFVELDGGCDADAAGQPVCYLKTGAPQSAPKDCRCGGPVSRASVPAPPQGAPGFSLKSAHVTASFGARGLLAVAVDGVAATVQGDAFALALDGAVVNSSALADPVASQPDGGSVQFAFAAAPYAVTVLYEARDEWRFVRKTLTVSNAASPAAPIWVSSVSPWDALALTFAAPVAGVVYPSGDLGTYGVFARLADGTGVDAAATNPMLYPQVTAPAFSPNGALIHVGYHPSMIWNQTTALDPTPRPFVADAGLLGFYALSPNAVPPAVERDEASPRFRTLPPYIGAVRASHATDTNSGMRFEYEPLSAAALPAGLHMHAGAPADPSWLNYAERDAYRALGEAHFELPHNDTVRVHIPWTENARTAGDHNQQEPQHPLTVSLRRASLAARAPLYP